MFDPKKWQREYRERMKRKCSRCKLTKNTIWYGSLCCMCWDAYFVRGRREARAAQVDREERIRVYTERARREEPLFQESDP